MRAVKKVLVTGASGFIGLPVIRAVSAASINVIGLDLVPNAADAEGVSFLRGSFTDTHFVYRLLERERPDTIVHTGGISGPMLARDDPQSIFHTNVVGTVTLLEAARVLGVKRFVHCGSALAFGDTPPAPVPDDPPLRATDVYGATKGATDLMLRAYRAQHGLDAVSLRISNGYGPGRRTFCAVCTMLMNALRGVPTHMEWGGSYRRAYLYVDDAVSAIMAAVSADGFSQWSYNIAGPDFVQMLHIADIVRSLIPGAVITMKDGKDTLGYRREALDTSAASRDIGWAPQIGIEEGVRLYLDWIRANEPMGEALR